MNNLNIAMVLDNAFNPDLRVLREARTLIQAGHSVTIFAWNREINSTLPDHEIIEGIYVKRIPVSTGRQLGLKQIPKYIKFVFRLIRMYSFDEFDVIHCHDLPCLVIGVYLKLVKRKILVYDAHEIYWIMESHKYPPVILWLIKSLEIGLLKFNNAMITVSTNRFDYYKKYYKKTIVIIGNWYDAQIKNDRKRADFRQKHNISPDSFVISYTGTLDQSRSLDKLVESANQLEKLQYPVDWVIAGSGPLEKYIQESSIQNSKIHYLGWMEDISPVYSATDALIYLMDTTHPYTDFNSPNNLFLSIAWGIPLIAVEKGDIAATLSPNHNGLLLNEITANSITETIKIISADASLFNRLRSNLIVLQEKYNWQICARRLVCLYNDINPH